MDNHIFFQKIAAFTLVAALSFPDDVGSRKLDPTYKI